MTKPSISPLDYALPFPLTHACTLAGILQTLIATSPLAVVALDVRHRFTTGNSAFHAMFGYTADALLHADFDEAITSYEMRDEARRLSAAVLDGQRVHANSTRRRSDGTLLQVEISGIPLIEQGQLAGVYGLYRCVSGGLSIDTDRSFNGSNPNLPQKPIDAVGVTAKHATKLTGREQHLLRLLAAGHKSKGIAQKLGISVRTVESHRSNINQKCGFKSVADLVRFAILQQNPDPFSQRAT